MARSKTNKGSKRLSCRKKFKIEKKVREHIRKNKKQKEKKLQNKFKGKNDPGVPNNCPFKEDILKEAIKKREEADALKTKQREVKKRKRTLEAVVADATKKNASFEQKQRFLDEKSKEIGGVGNKQVENSLSSFFKEVKNVIEGSDIVIQVLDARDPLGSRCRQIEEMVVGETGRKKLILLLNKIDLVPKENVEKWLKYLRKELPTLPFKASTQNQSYNLSRSSVPVNLASRKLMKSSSCLGADLLMTLLGNYCHRTKSSVTIGIIGFPNTGKSSIINSLKRTKTCNVGSTPGITRTMQSINLDKHIKLLDSPGVVMANDLQSDEEVVLRNCVKLETLEDPIPTVSAILGRCHKHKMMLFYNLPTFNNVDEFLVLVSKRFGLLRKGGIPDVNKAAKAVIKDWNRGKITYYTEPPEDYKPSEHIKLEIVTEMRKEFDIDALDDDSVIQALDKPSNEDDIVLSNNDITDVEIGDEEEEDEEEEEEEEMETEEPAKKAKFEVQVKNFKGNEKRSKNSTGEEVSSSSAVDVTSSIAGNEQVNKERVKMAKKKKKKTRKADNLSKKLGSALDAVTMNDDGDGVGDGDDGGDGHEEVKNGDEYDFKKHFD